MHDRQKRLTFSNLELPQFNVLGYWNIYRKWPATLGFRSTITIKATFSSISDPPLLDSSHPQDQLTTEGDAVTLKCVIKASNPYPDITWIKLNDSEKTFAHGPILNLTSVTRVDGGMYRCLADNSVGGQIKSRLARLEVQCKLIGISYQQRKTHIIFLDRYDK